MATDEQIARLGTLSFEFFPPHSAVGMEKLDETAKQLALWKPNYFSVTFGAGGSTQTLTLDTVKRLMGDTGIPVAPHISCIGSSSEQIRALLATYKSIGVSRLVALRGDLPSGMVSPGEFQYANELIAFIRAETGDYFHIEVAAYPEFHPEASTATADLMNFKRKIEVGANSAITQYFYNADAYFHFVDSCRKIGIEVPIVPGIMPITNYRQLARFSDNCGAEIPRWMRKRLGALDIENSQDVMDFGLDVVSELCEHLLQGGVPGLHFYTLNQVKSTLAILDSLGLSY